jgi:hypothetical protein
VCTGVVALFVGFVGAEYDVLEVDVVFREGLVE